MLIIKSCLKLEKAMSGTDDIDILLPRNEIKNIKSIKTCRVNQLESQYRYDIFKIYNGRLIHFDAHEEYRLGPKFAKNIPYLELENVLRYQLYTSVKLSRYLKIDKVSESEEMKIFLARDILRNYSNPLSRKYYFPDIFSQEFNLSTNSHHITLHYSSYQTHLLVESDHRGYFVKRKAASRLRSQILKAGSITETQYLKLIISHLFKACLYGFARKLSVKWVTKRGIPGGLVVAFVAPDGLGKTTLVNEIYRRFGHKFDCYRFYLGIGDGKGFWLRQKIQRHHSERFKASEQNVRPPLKRKTIALIRCLFGLTVAIEKWFRIQKILRAKKHNALVFVDRWPHNTCRKGMDGPIKSPKEEHRLCKIILQLEQKIYDNIAKAKPDLLILLDATHAVSHDRKPGEICKKNFDIKMTTAKTAFSDYTGYHSVDASRSVSDVSKSVMNIIKKLLQHR